MLDVVERLKEEKLNATKKLVDRKLQTELFLFVFFSPLEVLLLDTNKPFHDGGRYHIETSPLICRATGFYMITAPVMKGLNVFAPFVFFIF